MTAGNQHDLSKAGLLLLMRIVRNLLLVATLFAYGCASPESKKTAHLSWKDTSGSKTGFRIYRILGNQKTKIAEVGPNVTTYVDKESSPKACYVVTAFNSAGESPATDKVCRQD
jgi:hypothetical protein